MTLPAFATLDDLAARLPAEIGAVDDARAQATLEDVSATIRTVAGKTWVTEGELDEDIPDIILTICCKAAQRAFTNPNGVSQQASGPFSETLANASSDVYLTVAEKGQVRQAAGKTDLTSIRVEAPVAASASRFLSDDLSEDEDDDE